MKKACVDIGTNSILCLVADVSADKIEILEDFIDIVRLGEGMTGEKGQSQFLPSALQRFEVALLKIKDLIDRHNVAKVEILATAAARRAKNSEELEAICKKHGFNLNIISGEKEANLTFAGANYNLNIDPYVVIDIGGGSTEILWRDGEDLIGKSLDVGAVFLKEKFFPNETYNEKEISAAKSYVLNLLESMPARPPSYSWVAVAGTPTTIAACELAMKEYDAGKLHGSKLSRDILQKWLVNFNVEKQKRESIVGLDSRRADIIFAGNLILDIVADYYAVETFYVSVGGLRFGAMKE